MSLHITGDTAADEILADPFALLLGMLLDQKYPPTNGNVFDAVPELER